MSRFTRRNVLAALGSAPFVAGAAERASAQSAANLSGQTIVHWDFLSPDGKSPRELAIKEIETDFRRRTGITVNFQILPWQDMGTKLITAVQAGNPPDCSRVNLYHLKMILPADGLTPLNPYIAKTFSEEDRKDFLVDFTPAMVVNDVKGSMEIETIPKALFIRKDWLTNAGLQAPKTWAEFVEVGKAFTGNGRWGYMFGASKTQLNQVETIFQPQIHGRGGHILDTSDRAVFNDDIAVKSYQFLGDCVHKHRITPAQVIAMTYDDVTDAFKAGRVGMIQEGAHRYADIANAIGRDKLELAKVPSDDRARPSPTIVTGWGMGIPRGSKHPDAAWEHIKAYLSPEAQETNARYAGTLPSRRSVLQRPFFQTPEAAYLRWWVDYMSERSEVVINVSTFTQLNEALVDPLHQIIADPRTNIRKVLDESVATYNQVVAN